MKHCYSLIRFLRENMVSMRQIMDAGKGDVLLKHASQPDLS